MGGGALPKQCYNLVYCAWYLLCNTYANIWGINILSMQFDVLLQRNVEMMIYWGECNFISLNWQDILLQWINLSYCCKFWKMVTFGKLSFCHFAAQWSNSSLTKFKEIVMLLQIVNILTEQLSISVKHLLLYVYKWHLTFWQHLNVSIATRFQFDTFDFR